MDSNNEHVYDSLDDGEDMGTELTLMSTEGSPSGSIEHLAIASCRTTPLVLTMKRTNEVNYERDAIMLEAILSSTLEKPTWNSLVSSLIRQYALNSSFVKDYIRQSVESSVTASLAQFLTGEKTPSRRRKPTTGAKRGRKPAPPKEDAA